LALQNYIKAVRDYLRANGPSRGEIISNQIRSSREGIGLQIYVQEIPFEVYICISRYFQRLPQEQTKFTNQSDGTQTVAPLRVEVEGEARPEATAVIGMAPSTAAEISLEATRRNACIFENSFVCLE
jgi:hypothetical protein